MAFSRHPHAKEREAQNAAALQAAGLDPAGVERFFGKLVHQGDPGYNADRQMSNAAFQAYPNLIAYCLGPSDIQWCFDKSFSSNRYVVCRSGGHSTAGYSVLDGRIVIDMTYSFNHVIVDPNLKIAVVGTGLNFGALNETLSSYGLHVPGGGCPDVRIGGYMQGGGFGFTSRQFGMNCDNVESFSMLLWNGGTVFASPSLNADLYWAVRGGTGNNFGVVMWVEYKLQPLDGLWGAWLQWPLTSSEGVHSATQALVTLQQGYMNGTNDSRFGYMVLISTQNQQPVMMLRAAFTGSEAELNNLLAPLIETGGTAPPGWPMKKWSNYATINYELLAKPYEIPQFPTLPTGQEWAEDKQSGYIEKKLQQSDWNGILSYFLQSPLPYTTMVIEPYGGFINQVPVGDSAFIHRNVSMDVFVDVFWNTAYTSRDKPTAEAYLDGFMDLIGQHSNGHQYQNYPRRTTTNYQWAYWGPAYRTLTQVKKKYDPLNFFNFPQSIGLESDLSAVPTKADSWLDKPIVYATPPQRTSK